MKYTTAKIEDTEQIYLLVQNTIKTVYPKYYPSKIVDFFCEHHSYEKVFEDIKNGFVRTLFVDNRLVCTVSYQENHISRLFVAPEFQSKGYGSCIMKRIENELSAYHNTIYLDSSLAAVRFYEHNGYETVRHEELSVANDSILVYEIMKKLLCVKEDKMEISYKETHDFTKEELQDLFLSVEWSSGHYPEKLVLAMQNFETVYTAWDGDKLIGLISAMDDNIMTAYVHYLLVEPQYQHNGIGKKLIEMVKERYKEFLRIVVVAYNSELKFYESCGFEKAINASPMFITDLWT